jgi:uncharacterized protein YjeT (DUF2065 family)
MAVAGRTIPAPLAGRAAPGIPYPSADCRKEVPVQQPERPRGATRLTGIALIGAGTGVIVLALVADQWEIGGGDGFGYQQLIALIVGIVLILGGLGIMLQTALGAAASRAQRDADQ